MSKKNEEVDISELAAYEEDEDDAQDKHDKKDAADTKKYVFCMAVPLQHLTSDLQGYPHRHPEHWLP